MPLAGAVGGGAEMQTDCLGEVSTNILLFCWREEIEEAVWGGERGTESQFVPCCWGSPSPALYLGHSPLWPTHEPPQNFPHQWIPVLAGNYYCGIYCHVHRGSCHLSQWTRNAQWQHNSCAAPLGLLVMAHEIHHHNPWIELWGSFVAWSLADCLATVSRCQYPSLNFVIFSSLMSSIQVVLWQEFSSLEPASLTLIQRLLLMSWWTLESVSSTSHMGLVILSQTHNQCSTVYSSDCSSDTQGLK